MAQPSRSSVGHRVGGRRVGGARANATASEAVVVRGKARRRHARALQPVQPSAAAARWRRARPSGQRRRSFQAHAALPTAAGYACMLPPRFTGSRHDSSALTARRAARIRCRRTTSAVCAPPRLDVLLPQVLVHRCRSLALLSARVRCGKNVLHPRAAGCREGECVRQPPRCDAACAAAQPSHPECPPLIVRV